MEAATATGCGAPETHTWKPSDCDDVDNNNNNNNNNCQEREYILYRPKILCQESGEGDGVVLPLVFALHCLGCPPSVMMHWTEIAESFNFVLVIPTGLQHSFNGGFCCGYALEHDIDDVGFLRGILHQTTTTTLPSQEISVSSDAVYAIGWSNGAYLSIFASSLFRAIAPISGYQVDFDSISNFFQTPAKSTSIFLHHARDDRVVQMTGCCSSSDFPRCCCGLDALHDECISVEEYWTDWTISSGGGRGASSAAGTGAGHTIATTTTTTTISNENVTCRTMDTTEIDHSSKSVVINSTLCIHERGGHFNRPSFSKGFPMTREIAIFFARDACLIHDGTTWSEDTHTCTCPSSSSSSSFSPYCLEGPSSSSSGSSELDAVGTTTSSSSSGSGSTEKNTKVVTQQDSNHVEGVAVVVGTPSYYYIVAAALCFGIYYYARQRRRRRRKYSGFEKVSTVELGTTSSS
jgi:poly(3-hydroxybutyrate) depolymerase